MSYQLRDRSGRQIVASTIPVEPGEEPLTILLTFDEEDGSITLASPKHETILFMGFVTGQSGARS